MKGEGASDAIGNTLTVQGASFGGGETFAFSYNRQNQLTAVPHSGTTPIIGKVNAQANVSVLTSETFQSTTARQGEDYRVRLVTGIQGTDRYLSFTNYGVLNQGSNPDIVSSNVVKRFLPKDVSETQCNVTIRLPDQGRGLSPALFLGKELQSQCLNSGLRQPDHGR